MNWVVVVALILSLLFVLWIYWPEKASKQASCYNQPRTDIKPYKPPEAQPKPVKPSQAKRKPGSSADTIKAMHLQADAERAIAETLELKAEHITDPVKRARIARQAANSWLRFNKILDQIDKITQQ